MKAILRIVLKVWLRLFIEFLDGGHGVVRGRSWTEGCLFEVLAVLIFILFTHAKKYILINSVNKKNL